MTGGWHYSLCATSMEENCDTSMCLLTPPGGSTLQWQQCWPLRPAALAIPGSGSVFCQPLWVLSPLPLDMTLIIPHSPSSHLCLAMVTKHLTASESLPLGQVARVTTPYQPAHKLLKTEQVRSEKPPVTS